MGSDPQSFPLPLGLNAAAAAAVAALSQLTQFAGTMDAAERAMAGMQARQWHGKGGVYRPMIGPGHGPGAFHGHGPMHHGRGPMRPPVWSSLLSSSYTCPALYKTYGFDLFQSLHPINLVQHCNSSFAFDVVHLYILL